MKNLLVNRLRSASPIFMLCLAACSSDDGGTTPVTPPPPTYSVGGTLTGLTAGNSITLTNNATDNLALSTNGVFTFLTELGNGAAYSLTLSPTTPNVQPCTSTYGAGTINAADITNINVFCGLPGGLGTYTATTGSMATPRYSHTSTILPNGKVLVSGGYNSPSSLDSAELYDPATGMWAPTDSLDTPRYSHTATLLPNGKVLVSGGRGTVSALDSAELYDPTTGIWTATGPLATPRESHAATLLHSGKVLVGGGLGATVLTSTELYF